jgi:hypothetical protein
MKNTIEKINNDGQLVWKINRKSKIGQYKILKKDGQGKYCSKIRLEGFERLPSGFYRNDGYGLTAGGNILLQEIFNKFGKKVALTITVAGPARLDGRGQMTKAIIPHPALADLNASVRAIKYKRNEETRAVIQNFLGVNFRQFTVYKGAKPQYAPGSLSATLDYQGIVEKLSVEDRERIEEFIPEYLSKIPGTLKAKKKLQVIYDSIDAGKKVYLGKVLKEFRSKLKRKIQNESIWQTFLSKYILVLRNTYGEVLEKESVSLKGKFPDFMLIDPYSYLDIYEIKKPSTVLLRHDKSRNNYYWDAELSKAIAQVENYLHQVQRYSDALINEIRKNKGIDVSIVRPRGYIIAGTREQLKPSKMLDDFRILNESLKNIDVIFYDDLLKNLETFVERVG